MTRSTLKKVMLVERPTANTVGLSLVLALVLGLALWVGPSWAQTCPPNEPCEPHNSSPTVRANSASVVVVQGQTATNTGTYSDDDSPGDVTITASVGNVTKTGTNSGTWSWSLANVPLGRQQVTITATDSQGADRSTSFTVTGTYPNGKIAFTSGRDGNGGEIYTMNPDGSSVTRLTNNPERDNEPAFSPDGTRIAFSSSRDNGNEEIYVMNANGGGLMRLTFEAQFDYEPAFSPDGSKIAFWSQRDRNREVYVMDTDGSNPTNLTDNWDSDTEPTWSPDGSKIAFRSNRDGNDEIYVMNSDGTGQTRLTSNAASDLAPTFSPDGRRIAFQSNRDGNNEIYVMDSDGAFQTRLTSNAASDSYPAFSPDGTKIAFASNRDGDSEIYVMNSDGTGQTNLTNNTRGDVSPSWGGASDTAPPETTVTSGPSGPVNSTSAEFAFSSSERDSVFECSLDGGPFELCSSPKSYPNLAEGQHTFQVRATDVSGNTDPTPVSRTWTVDTTVPETTIDSGPSGTVNSSSATFAFSSTEANAAFECRLTRQGDTPGSFAACTSPNRQSNLVDGSYTFEVRAKDAAGNTDQSPASRTWTVDATAPETTIDIASPPVTNSRQASFYFSSSEDNSIFECSLDGGAWQACTSPKDYAELSDGQHTFSVRAKDSVGNVDPSPATHVWTVDATVPETTIDSGPSGTVNTASASFGFSSESGATFECKLDGGVFEPCSSPKSYTALANGQHTFLVKARDAAGNEDASPASRTWTVDTVKPTVSGMSPRHGSITTDTTPTIKATVKDNLTNLSKSNIKLYVNGVLISATKYTYSSSTDLLIYNSPRLSLGKKTVKIVATDAARNVGVRSWYFTIR